MIIPLHRQHWAYVWIPVFGAFIWFGTLLAMLITYLAQGRPQYVTQQGKVAYISDVGASFLKPLFVVCCCITGTSFFLSLCVERWLRHSGRLIPDMRRRERTLGILAIIGSFIGMWGLILLSGFDTKRYPSLHRAFLLVFMIGVALSAIFTITEYRWISKDFIEIRKLKHAYIAKALIAGILILLAIAFGITLYYVPDVGAILEWTISFGFTLYLLTYYYDLRMAKGIEKGQYNKNMLAMGPTTNGPGTAQGEVPVYGNGGGTFSPTEGYRNGFGNGDGSLNGNHPLRNDAVNAGISNGTGYGANMQGPGMRQL
ncbi:hypothetical protein SERLA73DRAFT_181935 [Serpula lacrymans var. lacrymans S7.3]|uniref:CWH43-like N-terminal domain-containing protein n=2 Tax=Serpula lacrymans var. lacrymans TaxID=341189 RepID=F8PZ02_SERL3|nr:uncharacterized protein SERLADRAFT_468361 [Serpula lacrymans var. lacrymans S7.9]EGN99115.1 hypothetical protein SERLA73DRAFT_181935 [Serpula lacrymans var. lacrymans S7.3]EGO24684.1 hypothetical protein SERLADRAFT_468361 [Serpula lacrymans var. lacrymans S7.9]